MIHCHCTVPGPHWQARLQYCKISGKLLVQTELVSVSGDYTVKSLPSGTNHSHLYRTQQVVCDCGYLLVYGAFTAVCGLSSLQIQLQT